MENQLLQSTKTCRRRKRIPSREAEGCADNLALSNSRGSVRILPFQERPLPSPAHLPHLVQSAAFSHEVNNYSFYFTTLGNKRKLQI